MVDSIQTVFLEDATGSPGSVSQVRECATALLHAAKTTGMPVFIVGHVTKSGDIAGPRVLEHIVDVVLYLEGDADRAVRILRGHKNRYGSTDEVGVFQMSDDGLTPVASPSASSSQESGRRRAARDKRSAGEERGLIKRPVRKALPREGAIVRRRAKRAPARAIPASSLCNHSKILTV